MSYSKDIYNSAVRTMEKRRQKAELELSNRRARIYSRNKDIEVLENSLAHTGVSLAKAVLNGSNAKSQVAIIKQKSQDTKTEINNILKSMGLPQNYLQIQYECPLCKDTGYKDGKMCECFKKLMREIAFKKLNDDSPLSVSRFEDFNLNYYSKEIQENKKVSPYKRMSDIYNYCVKYANEFSADSNSILMQGNTGLGKTHLSLSIASRVIEKGYGVVYSSTPTLISNLETEHFSYNRSEDTKKYLIDCDLLILDDLGTEFTNNFSTSTIYNILNSRILLSKPTIISTNLSLRDMEKIYSSRFVSRIMGNNDRLEFIGKDLRQKIKTSKRY